MGLFNNSEVIILKESCDSKDYLNRLQELRNTVPDKSRVSQMIDKEIAITEAGIFGEDSVLFELKSSGMDLIVIRDLFIETADGRSAQIDFFVITPYVNVIIECKNLFGNIEINNKGDFIRSFEYKGHKYKEGIYSPITQNERHLAVYKDCRKEEKNAILKIVYEKNFEEYNRSVVVLANPKTVVNDKWAKKEVKDQVIRSDQLIKYLKNLKTDAKSSKKQMKELGEKILAMNVGERKDYLKKYEELAEETKVARTDQDVKPIEAAAEEKTSAKVDAYSDSNPLKDSAEPNMICPRCGSKLVLRTAKRGENTGNQFYGCSAFPKCRYIMNINEAG